MACRPACQRDSTVQAVESSLCERNIQSASPFGPATKPSRDIDILSMSFLISAPFPLFDHLHNITDFPKAGLDACGHSRSHAVRAADLDEVVVHRVQSERVNVV